jgi:hypothetical protein
MGRASVFVRLVVAVVATGIGGCLDRVRKQKNVLRFRDTGAVVGRHGRMQPIDFILSSKVVPLRSGFGSLTRKRDINKDLRVRIRNLNLGGREPWKSLHERNANDENENPDLIDCNSHE